MMIRRSVTTATLVLVLFALTSCSSDRLLGPHQGRVRVVLSGDMGANASANLAGAASADANEVLRDDDDDDDEGDDDDRPSRWFHAANVTLSSILARNLDGVLVNLDLDLPVTVDVVRIESGKVIELPDGVLPVGGYDQVVLVMTAVRGVLLDGTIITIEPPGGGWTSIVPICPLEVTAGGAATVGIDLMVRNSFRWGDNRFHFQPRFRSATDCPDGGE